MTNYRYRSFELNKTKTPIAWVMFDAWERNPQHVKFIMRYLLCNELNLFLPAMLHRFNQIENMSIKYKVEYLTFLQTSRIIFFFLNNVEMNNPVTSVVKNFQPNFCYEQK